MKIRISYSLTIIAASALLLLSPGFGEKMEGHDHSMHKMKSASHSGHQKAPNVEKEILAALYDSYLGVQKALAGDNLNEAKKEAAKIEESVKKLNVSGDTTYAGKLNKVVSGIINAKDINAARDKFVHLSVLTISLLEQNKFDGEKSAIVYHCPMAAGGKGADWLQSTEGTKNPYYGKSMLACGSITKTIGK